MRKWLNVLRCSTIVLVFSAYFNENRILIFKNFSLSLFGLYTRELFSFSTVSLFERMIKRDGYINFKNSVLNFLKFS